MTALLDELCVWAFFESRIVGADCKGIPSFPAGVLPMPLSSIGGAPSVSSSSAASTSPAEQTKIQGSLEQTKNVPGSPSVNQSAAPTRPEEKTIKLIASQLLTAQSNFESIATQSPYPNQMKDMLRALDLVNEHQRAFDRLTR
jgi:hypothetical protein